MGKGAGIYLELTLLGAGQTLARRLSGLKPG